MESQSAITAHPNRILPRIIVIQCGGIALFFMICFLTERVLIASLLVIVLMLLVNRLTASQAMKHAIPTTDLTATETSFQLRLNKNVEQALQKNSLKNSKPDSRENNKNHLDRQNPIIRMIEKNDQGKVEYDEAKLRWRNEMNDQAFEKRIQTIFDRIRDAESEEYKEGIREIDHLLELRRNSLVNPMRDEDNAVKNITRQPKH